MRRVLFILPIVVFLMAFAGSASAATPKQTIAKLRTQLAASKHTVAKQKSQIGSLTRQRDDDAGQLLTTKASLTTANGNLAAANASLASANAALATSQTSLASAQGTVGSLQAALASAAADQVSVMSSAQLWALLGTVNQRFIAVADSRFTTSYFAGTSFFSYDFDFFAS